MNFLCCADGIKAMNMSKGNGDLLICIKRSGVPPLLTPILNLSPTYKIKGTLLNNAQAFWDSAAKYLSSFLSH